MSIRYSTMQSSVSTSSFVFDEKVRTTMIDGDVYYSVFDVLQVYGTDTNPRRLWISSHSRLENLDFDFSSIKQIQFPGAGERITPVGNKETIFSFTRLIGINLVKPIQKMFHGYIYVLHFEQCSGEYKIGIAKSIGERLNTYKAENPPSMVLVIDFSCYHSNCRHAEKEIHKKFKNQRIRGEWFHLSNSDIEWIKEYSVQID